MEKKVCIIRLEEKSWNDLKEIANINKRSFNKEIEYLIERRIKSYKKELEEEKFLDE